MVEIELLSSFLTFLKKFPLLSYRVMMFEDKANGSSCKPDGPPPKRDITSLP